MRGTIIVDATGKTKDEILEKLRTTLFNISQDNSNNALDEWVDWTQG